MLGAGRNIFSKLSSSSRRGFSIAATLQKNVWKKSNTLYLTYIVVGAVAVELIYGNATSLIWDTANRGKLYHQIDWSKFKSEDDEDEEEEEEDDDE